MKKLADLSSASTLLSLGALRLEDWGAVVTKSKKPGIIPLSGNTETTAASGNPGGAYGVPAAPDVYCTAGDRPGEIDLQWDPVTGAGNYLIEVSAERPVNWRSLGSTKQSKFTTQDLVSGTLYWFRVYAVNRAGKSKWSVPVMKIAP